MYIIMGQNKLNNMEDDDVIIIGCSEMPKPIKVAKVIKEKCKRDVVAKKIDDNVETLVITQRIQVKKQKFGSIKNVSTDMIKTNASRRNKYCKQCTAKYSTLNRVSCLNRVVPNCLRKNCKCIIRAKINNQKFKFITKKNREHIKKTPKDSSKIKPPASSLKNKDNLYLSSDKIDLSYDEISLDSIENYIDSSSIVCTMINESSLIDNVTTTDITKESLNSSKNMCEYNKEEQYTLVALEKDTRTNSSKEICIYIQEDTLLLDTETKSSNEVNLTTRNSLINKSSLHSNFISKSNEDENCITKNNLINIEVKCRLWW